MRIGIEVGDAMGPVSLGTIGDRIREAAAAGLSAAWMAQLFGWDALTALAVAGRDVPGIALGTAVVQTYPRHPLALASQALSVQAATGNRLHLGIGPSHQFIIEDMFGYSFEKPARHMRDYLAVLAPLLRGESVTYQGETLKVEGTTDVPGAEPPALLIAALGPVMLRLAGELTDGTITAWTGPATIAGYIVPTITKAAADAGRPAPRVVAGVLVQVTSDADAARVRIAERFARAGQTPSYRAMLDREGAANPEDLLVAGDESAVARELRRYVDAGATELLAFPVGPDEERARTVTLLGDLARSGLATSAR
jgi:F420-dependent oxidoreductase-like protein